MMTVKSSFLPEGSLYIISIDGATIGSSPSADIVIDSVKIRKEHVNIEFSKTTQNYFLSAEQYGDIWLNNQPVEQVANMDLKCASARNCYSTTCHSAAARQAT